MKFQVVSLASRAHAYHWVGPFRYLKVSLSNLAPCQLYLCPYGSLSYDAKLQWSGRTCYTQPEVVTGKFVVLLPGRCCVAIRSWCCYQAIVACSDHSGSLNHLRFQFSSHIFVLPPLPSSVRCVFVGHSALCYWWYLVLRNRLL